MIDTDTPVPGVSGPVRSTTPYNVSVALPIWIESGLKTRVYVPVTGSLNCSRNPLEPLQELLVPSVAPSGFTIEREKT